MGIARDNDGIVAWLEMASVCLHLLEWRGTIKVFIFSQSRDLTFSLVVYYFQYKIRSRTFANNLLELSNQLSSIGTLVTRQVARMAVKKEHEPIDLA